MATSRKIPVLMLLSATVGALLGGVLAILFAPTIFWAALIGGALSTAAIATAVFVALGGPE